MIYLSRARCCRANFADYLHWTVIIVCYRGSFVNYPVVVFRKWAISCRTPEDSRKTLPFHCWPRFVCLLSSPFRFSALGLGRVGWPPSLLRLISPLVVWVRLSYFQRTLGEGRARCAHRREVFCTFRQLASNLEWLSSATLVVRTINICRCASSRRCCRAEAVIYNDSVIK